ncbi:MAG: hypothetical protein KF770_05420 [Anaerolineae bacterium]|nr:hypothetical protein [Anaerolineae bacterium]
MMRRKYRHWWACWLPFLLVLLAGMTEMPANGDVSLTIRLRAGDGTAVAGETVSLQRLPEEEPVSPECETDAQGKCTWYVGRGLYQVLFNRPLDDISALAVAEGGLRGLGITVGDADITYHFTFPSDGRVYFDTAPEAAVPVPLMPVGEAWHGGIAPTPSPIVTEDDPAKATPAPAPVPIQDTAVSPSPSGSFWRLLLFFGGGLALGGSIHWWSRRRQPALAHPPVIVEHKPEEHDA